MKTWFVSGASRGLGRSIVEAALGAGNRVLASARDPKPLEPLLGRFGERLRLATLDVTDEAAAHAAVGLAVETFGGVDVVVNTAGFGDLGSVEDTSLDSFRRQIEANLIGTIIVTKTAIPVLRRQRSGHIVQVSSVGGRIGALRLEVEERHGANHAATSSPSMTSPASSTMSRSTTDWT